jgi:hypothetical protein
MGSFSWLDGIGDTPACLLFDEMGGHIFRIEDGLTRHFDIR